MEIIPMSSLSLTIGTITVVRTPPSSTASTIGRMPFGIIFRRRHVSDVDCLFGSDHFASRSARRRVERTTPARLVERRRHIVARDNAESASFIEIEVAEFGLAEPRPFLQHGL